MKICLGQINTTPGDFTGNLEKVRVGIEAASKAQADLVVFPELTLPGYLLSLIHISEPTRPY